MLLYRHRVAMTKMVKKNDETFVRGCSARQNFTKLEVKVVIQVCFRILKSYQVSTQVKSSQVKSSSLSIQHVRRTLLQ